MEQKPALWKIDLFGPLRATCGARSIERFPTQKTAALLARLAFEPRLYSREELIGILWPDADPHAARNRLNQTLVWLRRQFADRDQPSALISDRQSVRLDPSAFTTDVAEFEAALRQARNTVNPDDKRQLLEQGIEDFTGELLPGHYEDWIFPERHRLQVAFLDALQQVAALHEQAGDYERAVFTLQRAVAADPLHEELHRELIRLLALRGQPAAALRQFHDLKAILKRELDEEPSAVTQALAQQIQAEARASVAVPAPGRREFPSLPAALTRFFGRETEIARLCEDLTTPGVRLVTLIGLGGAGKTRLALEAGARLGEAFDRAVAFVPLADITTPDLIVSAVADTLRLGPTPGLFPIEKVVQALSARPCLLLLDNLEHLLPEASFIIRELLERCPPLKLLVTSRQRASIEGEREMHVLPLALPPSLATTEELLTTASAQLFVDRARLARPDFQLTAHNTRVVAQLCARLEGIPLAIELCAAWIKTLTPAQIQDRLQARFDLLVSRRADSSARHRSLRAAIEYSYLRLPSPEQAFFACLSVFRGGWTLEAAEAVCRAVREAAAVPALEALTDLVEHSLIQVEEAGGEMRYRMLETLREFGSEALTEPSRSQAQRRHAEYFVRQAETAERSLRGPEQAFWLEQLERERENFRQALAWTVEAGELELGLRLSSALYRYWYTRGYLREGQEWLKRLLERDEQAGVSDPRPAQAGVIRGRAWNALGHLVWFQGDYVAARQAHETALAIRRSVQDRTGEAESLYHLGITAYRQADLPAAKTCFHASLALASELDDQAGIARVLLNLGTLAGEEGAPEEAWRHLQRSLTIERALGNRQRVADVLNNLGLWAAEQKDFSQAQRHFEEALMLQRELNDSWWAAYPLANLGGIARRQARYAEADARLKEGVTLAHESGDRYVLVYLLVELAFVAAACQQIERSVFLFAATDQLCKRIGASLAAVTANEHEPVLAAARVALGESVFALRWEEGQATPLAQVVAIALDASDELSLPALSGMSAGTPQAFRQEPATPALPEAAASASTHCPSCGNVNLVRNGKATNGKQKYLCRNCGKSSRADAGSSAYDAQFRSRVLAAYRERSSLRGVARAYGISRQTLLNWLKASELPPP